VLKTTDGGSNWLEQTTIENFSTLTYIKFFDENTGWAVGGVILKTTDGGNEWNEQTSGMSFFYGAYGIDMYDINNGIIVGLSGDIRKTTNGGFSWVLQTKNEKHGNNAVQFINENTGWVVGQYGKLLKTTDSGKNWFAQDAGIIATLNCLFFIDSLTGFIGATDGTVLKTTDSGNSWINTNTELNNYIYSLYFVNDSVGFITSIGIIYKTTNGGEKWWYKIHHTSNEILDIQFVNENIGFARGENDTLLTTTDCGETWNIIPLGDSVNISHIQFIDENTGWITGYSKIYKTTDGGKSLITQYNNSSSFIYNYNIHFTDLNNGWTFTNGSNDIKCILHTTDGGENWITEDTLFYGDINDIFFINENTGWIVGLSGWQEDANGAILKYSCTETAVDDALPFSEITDFQIFPNPSTNEITLSIPDEQNINSISILNSLGMEVKRIEQTELIGKSKITISTAVLPNGFYHCSFVNQTGRVTKSFVVLK